MVYVVLHHLDGAFGTSRGARPLKLIFFCPLSEISASLKLYLLQAIRPCNPVLLPIYNYRFRYVYIHVTVDSAAQICTNGPLRFPYQKGLTALKSPNHNSANPTFKINVPDHRIKQPSSRQLSLHNPCCHCPPLQQATTSPHSQLTRIRTTQPPTMPTAESAAFLAKKPTVTPTYEGVDFEDNIAVHNARDAIIREQWVRSMMARLVGEELGKCYAREGVNHLEKCGVFRGGFPIFNTRVDPLRSRYSISYENWKFESHNDLA